jgi:RNA polymerase sigma factor (sigma-70 family)
MHEEDLWSDLASGLSNTVPSNTSPKNTINIAIDDVSKATSKKVNGNEAVLRIDPSKGLIQPPSPLTPLPPVQPILEDLWSETSDTSLTVELLDLSTSANEPISSQDQESAGSTNTAGEEVSPEASPEEETDDLFESDLWGGLEEEEDEADEVMFEEESSGVLDEFEALSLQEEADSPSDWSNSSSSAEEINSDFFVALEQSAPLPIFESKEGPDTLLANFGLLDIEAELAEQERLEAEENAQPAEIEVIRARGGWGAPGWGGNSSILYINWEDESKAEEEALERLGYTTITLSEGTRNFIIQAARSARLTGQRERHLTTKLAEARAQLADLPDLTRQEATYKALQKEIAALEDKLRSVYLTDQQHRTISLQLNDACRALTQILDEIIADPYKSERNALKATITDIETQLVTQLQWVAVKKATHFLGQGIELDDLIQIGMLGVITGVRHFDRSRNTRLVVVVNWWVFQALTRAIADYGHLIRLPVHIYESLSQLQSQSSEMEWLLGRPPTRQELAAKVNLPTERVEELLRLNRKVISLSRYINAELTHEGYSFQPVQNALIVGENSISYAVEVDSMEQSIDTLLNCLTPRERKVMELRYGLFQYEAHTLEETGRRLKVTRERIRQIQEKAQRKLALRVSNSQLIEKPAFLKQKTNHKAS